MNKFKLLAIVLMMGVTSLFAKINTNPDTSKDEIRKQIIELVEQTTNVFENEISVKITFTFDTEGEIIVLSVDSKEKDVLSFIRENLNNKKLKNPGKVQKEYTLRISIK
jgi:hypothetical protein